MLYHIEWRVTDVQGQLPPPAMQPGVKLAAGKALAAAAAALAALQPMHAQQPPAIEAITFHAAALLPAAADGFQRGQAAIGGMLRSLAAEADDMALVVHDLPSAAAPAAAQHLQLRQQDVQLASLHDGYGDSLSAAVLWAPVLVRSAACSAAPPYNWVPRPQV